MPTKIKTSTKRGPGIWGGNLSTFGRFLKKHKLTRDDVAKGLGVTPSYVSMLAHAKASPGFKLAGKIADWTKAKAPEEFALGDW